MNHLIVGLIFAALIAGGIALGRRHKGVTSPGKQQQGTGPVDKDEKIDRR